MVLEGQRGVIAHRQAAQHVVGVRVSLRHPQRRGHQRQQRRSHPRIGLGDTLAATTGTPRVRQLDGGQSSGHQIGQRRGGGAQLSEGSWGAEIIDELAPQEGDILVGGKRGLDTFASTNLDFILRAKGITRRLSAVFSPTAVSSPPCAPGTRRVFRCTR